MKLLTRVEIEAIRRISRGEIIAPIGQAELDALCDMALCASQELKTGDRVDVYDRFRFGVPLQGEVIKISDSNDAVQVRMLQTNHHQYPIGFEEWFHAQQLVSHESADDAVTIERDANDRRANDRQVGGEHYLKHGKFQPWDAWWCWGLNAFQGAIVKYVVRYRDKNGIQDLEKAKHYLEKLIECEKGQT